MEINLSNVCEIAVTIASIFLIFKIIASEFNFRPFRVFRRVRNLSGQIDTLELENIDIRNDIDKLNNEVKKLKNKK